MQVESVTMLLGENVAPARDLPGWEQGQTLTARVVETPAPGMVRLEAGGRLYDARPRFQLAPGTEVKVRLFRRGAALRISVDLPQPNGNDLITHAMRHMLSQQQPAASLLADLKTLLTNQGAPPAIQRAVREFLAQLPTPATFQSPREIVSLIHNSGVWLEAKLAELLQAPTQAADLGVQSDLKAALLRLDAALRPLGRPRQSQDSNQASAAGPQIAPETHAPQSAPPLPYQMPHGERQQSDTLQQLALPALIGKLHAQTQGALARIQMHQLAALNADPGLPFWSLDLPIFDSQGAETIGITIEPDANREGAQTSPACTVTIAMEPAGLGPLWARLNLHSNHEIGILFYAERETSLAKIDAGLPALHQQLIRRGLQPATLASRKGHPSTTKSPAMRHLVDTRA